LSKITKKGLVQLIATRLRFCSNRSQLISVELMMTKMSTTFFVVLGSPLVDPTMRSYR